MRRAARVDANHAEIVAALRAVGCLVHDTSRLGGGFPDAVAAFRGRLVLLEIKDGRKPPSARKLTENEAEFHRTWGTAVAVVETVEQALAAVGARFA